MEINSEDKVFYNFVESLKPSLINYIRTAVNSDNNEFKDFLNPLMTIFGNNLDNLISKNQEALSVVLATLIYDYLAIGIITLTTDEKIQDLSKKLKDRVSTNQKREITKAIQNQINSFLSIVLVKTREYNSEIPFFQTEKFPLEQLIGKLIRSYEISKILVEFYLERHFSAFYYRQMKSSHYFELGISWNQKQLHGQVFTPRDIVDFLCREVIDNETKTVIDPAAGTGLFLLGALEFCNNHYLPNLNLIIGIEKDPVLSILCESALLVYCKLNSISNITCRVINANFFNCNLDSIGIHDKKYGTIAVLMNPPYTRQELLPDEEKSFLRNKINNTSFIKTYKKKFPSFKLSGQSGLYIYFILYLSEFLHQKDRLGLIIPNSWLDVKYGAVLQKILLNHYSIELILSTRLEKLFPPVDVNTSIVLLEYRDYTSSSTIAKSDHKVKFISIDCRSDLDYVSIFPENEPIQEVETITKVDISEYSLLNEKKWGLYLKAPEIYFTLMDRFQNELIPLKDFVLIRRGFTSGANDFFYLGKPGYSSSFFKTEIDPDSENLLLKPKDAETQTLFEQQGFFFDKNPIIIEKEYWMHKQADSTHNTELWIPNYLIKSPKEIKKFTVSEDDLSYIVLIIPATALPDLKPGIRKYISWGEKWKPTDGKPFNLRRTCAGRKYWYSLPAEGYQSYPLLCMMTLNDRYPFFYNPQNYYFDARLYGLSPSQLITVSQPNVIKFLFLYLNSIFTSLQLELLGRGNLGEGGLDIKVYEYNSVLILPLIRHFPKDLDSFEHLFSKLIKLHPSSLIEKEISKTNELLDEFLLQTSCFSLTEIKMIHNALAVMIYARLEKARTFIP
jgi:type I restriction-modification system DNA methylase subunit